MKWVIVIAIIFLFLLQLVSGLLVIYFGGVSLTKQQLRQIIQRIHEDVKYENGKWDTVYYNSDPELPGTNPVYILTTDGFVLERWKPLHGYLDVSDFKHLLSYQSPQTITTVSNQQWRVYSVPIESQGQAIGVISLSYYNPQDEFLDKIDQKLFANAQKIQKKVQVKNGSIDTTLLDIRQIDYDIAFQIVDKFNTIISKNNNNNSIDRLPNFIDASYVRKAMSGPPELVVADTVTGEKYLLLSSVITDATSHPLGEIVVGKSMSFIYSLMKEFFIFEGILGFISIFVISLVLVLFIKPLTGQKKNPKTISFLKNGHLIIDGKIISLPYATNQYYLCKMLFSSPRKRFETDELLDVFGEEISKQNARKVYDAMVHVNRKVSVVISQKLIVNKNKTYQINPAVSSLIR